MSDRIRLAEAMGTTRLIMAMGWTPAEDHSDLPEWRSMWFSPEGAGPQPRPNPYKDANFDYAVLEWMRENWQGKEGHHGYWHQAALSLWWRWDQYDVIVPYQIGDYARAALKVISNE